MLKIKLFLLIITEVVLNNNRGSINLYQGRNYNSGNWIFVPKPMREETLTPSMLDSDPL